VGTEAQPAEPRPRRETSRARQGDLLPLLLVAVAGTVAYINTFRVPFQFADLLQIVENTSLDDIGSLATKLAAPWSLPRRFVGYLSLALSHRLYGESVVGFHVENLLLHLATAWLLYRLVRLTFRLGGEPHPSADVERTAGSSTSRRVALAAALIDQGRFAEAAREARAAIRLEPGHPDAHYDLALALHRAGSLGAAIEEYRTAAALAPTDADILTNLGAALVANGQPEAAVEPCRRALELRPGDLNAEHWLAAARRGATRP